MQNINPGPTQRILVYKSMVCLNDDPVFIGRFIDRLENTRVKHVALTRVDAGLNYYIFTFNNQGPDNPAGGTVQLANNTRWYFNLFQEPAWTTDPITLRFAEDVQTLS